MGSLYLAALILGLGTIVAQLVMSGDGDADADGGGHDFGADADGGGHDLDADADADGFDGHDVDVHADADGHGGHGGGAGGFLPIILSFRFWTFGLMAFGMVGSILHFGGLGSNTVVALAAIAMGLGSGGLASFTFRALARAQTQSGAQSGDAVGQVGRVLIAPKPQQRGKIRIELSGETVDYLASTDEDALGVGDPVLVVEMRDDTAHVARPPDEFLTGSRKPD